ncbi:hypothetical protein ABRZ87_08530 [Vibrio vulnificus]|uniref:hypothetical protein n=1 Tax=Vibrio vulnificus TaxID=672 RepID=UPI0028CA576D|nr:hypothetical protein [Vibrio vulnificus]
MQQYILVCDEQIINTTCPTGFKSVILEQQALPQYMTLHDYKELAPQSILFLAMCYVWKKMRN